VTSSIDARGVAAGVTCSTPPPAAHTSYFTYDSYGQVLTQKDPLGHLTQRTYDADRNPRTVIDPTTQTTTYTYDPAGQLTQTLRPDTTTLHTDFWPDGSVKTQYDGANHHMDYAYDAQGRVTTSTDPLGRVTTFGYDAAGNRTSVQQSGGNCAAVPKTGCITFTFDAANQLTGIDYSDSATPDVTNITYDPDGHRTAMTDGTGTTTYVWDSLGRMTSSAAPGGTVGYGYDLRNFKTSIVYPNALGTVNRVFDDAGRLQSVTDWLSKTTSYGYDADSNLTSQTNPNGTTETITVDDADRVMGISHAPTATPGSPFASFIYGRDNEDKVTSVAATGVPTDNRTWGYTNIDQVSTDTARAFPYAYDAADNLTQLTDGTVQSFDAANQLTSTSGITRVGTGGGSSSTAATVTVTLPAGVQANDQILVSTVQPANTNVTTPTGFSLVGPGSWQTGNNASNTKLSAFRKTAAGGETSVAVTFSSATVAKTVAVAVYRGVNATTPVEIVGTAGTSSTNTVIVPSVTTTTANDQLVAILGASQGALPTAVWSAPTGMTKEVEQSIVSTDGALADQRVTAAGATGTRTATLGTTGKLVGVLAALKPAATTATFGYDTRGNRTTRTASTTTTYGYDQVNRLATFSNGASTTYSYNADGLRTGRGGANPSTFRWDESSDLPVLLVDGTTAYVYGTGTNPIEQISGSTVLTYHTDQLGSTRAITNNTGTVVATYTYDTYGGLAASTGSVSNPFGFAGEYRDTESGLIYLRARYYEPSSGQFLTRDPLEDVTRSAYGYVEGDPLDGSDPTGLYVETGDPVTDGIEITLEGAIAVTAGAIGVLHHLTHRHKRRSPSVLRIQVQYGKYTASRVLESTKPGGVSVADATAALHELVAEQSTGVQRVCGHAVNKQDRYIRTRAPYGITGRTSHSVYFQYGRYRDARIDVENLYGTNLTH
jgi:RHS repeat-associated protein